MSRELKLPLEQIERCLAEIIEQIELHQETLGNIRLLEICQEAVDFFEQNANPHLCHEIAETALNSLVKNKYAKNLLLSKTPASAAKEILIPLTARLPTQTWRSREQIAWQQFSTPPAISYLLAWLLNLREGNRILEPSAGTGSLAVWASGLGLTTFVNEIDSRRRLLLTTLEFKPTGHNAEFIHDFLPAEAKVNCVIMNPPFSANGGRTRHNSSKFGFRHVESALERLDKGGKFGIILGEFADLSTKTGREFWGKMSGKFSVRAIININGREYYKYGTRVNVTLIIGEKLLEERNANWNAISGKIAQISAQTVEDAFSIAQNLGLRLD